MARILLSIITVPRPVLPACLVRKMPFALGRRLGDVVVMAVDAAIRGMGGADAGRQKDDLFSVTPSLEKPIGNGLLQIEYLVVVRRLFNHDLMLKTVDDDHDIPLGLSRNLQGIEAGILEIGAEVAAEIGYSGNARQGGEGNRHAFARPRELGNAAQRAGRKNQGIFRITGRRPGRDGRCRR